MNWNSLYKLQDKPVEFVDVGCGYGGLLISLAKIFPTTKILGIEIRLKVCDYVKRRIESLRQSNCNMYGNTAVIRGNAMKHLPCFFKKGQLTKMFFLFPDPHFKKKKHKARIITPALLAEYAYFLAVGGMIYVATDVKELFGWMSKHLNEHPLFKKIDHTNDPVIPLVKNSTEEGHKVSRNHGDKFIAVYQRIENPIN